jgi:hypothetical protein
MWNIQCSGLMEAWNPYCKLMIRQAAKEIDIMIARNNADYRLLITCAEVGKDEVW